MRLGKVIFDAGYVVDLDDEEMVEAAVISVCEDVYNAVKYGEVSTWVHVSKEPEVWQEEDIPEFLKNDNEDLYGEEL
jgi:hypothetical protein